MVAPRLRAFALFSLLLPLSAFAAIPAGGAVPPVPAIPDLCGGIPGFPNPNAGCELPLERGVNLAIWLQYWIPSRYTTSEDLQKIRDLGFTFVRLPVNPELLLTGTPGHRGFHQANADFVKGAIRLAIEKDLAVIVDMHPYDDYTRLVLTNEAYLAEYTGFLANFTKLVADLPHDRIAIGLLNEPFDPDWDPNTPFDYNPVQYDLWKAVRLADLGMTIVATGDDWSSIEGLLRVEPLPDPNVLYEFHFYKPFLFTHQGATWTWYVVKPIRDLPYPATIEGVEAVRASILDPIQEPWIRSAVSQHLTWYGQEGWDRSRLHDEIATAAFWAEEHDVRLFLGEFGVYDGPAPQADRARWTRDVREIAEDRGIAWAYWNYDSDFGVVDRKTGAPIPHILDALTG